MLYLRGIYLYMYSKIQSTSEHYHHLCTMHINSTPAGFLDYLSKLLPILHSHCIKYITKGDVLPPTINNPIRPPNKSQPPPTYAHLLAHTSNYITFLCQSFHVCVRVCLRRVQNVQYLTFPRNEWRQEVSITWWRTVTIEKNATSPTRLGDKDYSTDLVQQVT